VNRVLIIEDDPSLLLGLTTALEAEGYGVESARTGPEGLRLAVQDHPDLILLDLMLPGMSGFEICKRIRDHDLRSKVIMLTSRSEENDRVFGLELGADDYVTKPFSLRELLARVRAHLRRDEVRVPTEPERPARLHFGDVIVDLDRHEVRRAGAIKPLTRREFRLLEFFIHHPSEVLSRERLLKEAWGHAEQQTTRTVDNHVLRLRKHIEPDPERPRYIKTARGAGYLFEPPIQSSEGATG
jgi:two-component system, OmpR family, alkaline phosphatase synthesis response regulator PhoP